MKLNEITRLMENVLVVGMLLILPDMLCKKLWIYDLVEMIIEGRKEDGDA